MPGTFPLLTSIQPGKNQTIPVPARSSQDFNNPGVLDGGLASFAFSAEAGPPFCTHAFPAKCCPVAQEWLRWSLLNKRCACRFMWKGFIVQS
jgi:hypothetical protein